MVPECEEYKTQKEAAKEDKVVAGVAAKGAARGESGGQTLSNGVTMGGGG